MGNSRFAYDKASAGGETFSDGDQALVLLDSLYVGAFDEPGKGEVLLSFSFSTFPAAAGELEPDTILKEIGLPKLKNRTEVGWMRGVVLFGPAPVRRSLALSASVLEIDRGEAAARRVEALASFAGRLGSPAGMALSARGFGVLGSLLAVVNSLNADDLVLQETETFLTAKIEGVPQLHAGRIGILSGHTEASDRTRIVLSVRRILASGPRRAAAAADSGGARGRAARTVRFHPRQR